jgi:hypothetical protein
MLHANPPFLAREFEKMAVNKLVRRVCTGAAASVLMVPLAQAAQLAVNDEVPLTIVSPGFSYVTEVAGQSSALAVATDGYLFCANIGESAPNIVNLMPTHSRWTLPSAYLLDARYTGGKLNVNRTLSGSIEHSLTCQVRGAQGQVFNPYSPFGMAIFSNGYESLEPTQYASMINWKPVDGFDWAAPDWTEVPTDACQFEMTPENSPHVAEPALCAAATGITAGGEFGVRAPKMWTWSSGAAPGSSYVYLARIDVRLGGQVINVANEGFEVNEEAGIQELPNAVEFAVRDGYDSQYLSAGYTYCLLNTLPASLSASTCNGNNPTQDSGIVSRTLTMDFETVTSLSRYLVVIRTKTADSPPINTPVSAVAVLSDPRVSRDEAGDTFAGDNVIFGFSVNGDGFPWMTQ